MTFEEAKTALAKLAGKEAYVISYELMTYQIYDNPALDVRPTCSIYIHGQHWAEGATWAEALKKLSDGMGKTGADASEAPMGEEAGRDYSAEADRLWNTPVISP